MHDDQAAGQHGGGYESGTQQSSGSSGSSGSSSTASTLILEPGRNDRLPLGGGRPVGSGPQGSRGQGERRDAGLSDNQPAEDLVLRAWFNVVARVGEVVCPDARVVIRDPHAFMTCLTMTGFFARQGVGAAFLVGFASEAQGDGGVSAVSVMNEAGRVVSLTYNMLTGAGTVYHPRGRVEFEEPNDLMVQVTYRIVGPAVRLARERSRWHLTRDGEPVGQGQHEEEPPGQDRPLGGDDRESVGFLRTQHMIAADDELEEDREALDFIRSHDHNDSPHVQHASARQVTVIRDESGNLQEVRANDRSRHQVNYSTRSADELYGRWAVVDPFSPAGARAALDAILLPSLWSQRRPVMLEIAPMRSRLPGILTMLRGFVFNPWSAEELRAAFRLMQFVARGRYPRIDPGESPREDGVVSPPAVTISITVPRD